MYITEHSSSLSKMLWELFVIEASDGCGMPVKLGFYNSPITNLGRLFQGGEEALTPRSWANILYRV